MVQNVVRCSRWRQLARALSTGLAVPPTLLALADKVIE